MAAERSGQGVASATTATYCSVGSDTVTPTPGANKKQYSAGTNAAGLGFSIADYVYFGYGIKTTGASKCGWAASASDVYTFFANGDLDGDNIMSTFELAAGTDKDDTLYHAKGFYIINEIE
jgi:hypothetical protein